MKYEPDCTSAIIDIYTEEVRALRKATMLNITEIIDCSSCLYLLKVCPVLIKRSLEENDHETTDREEDEFVELWQEHVEERVSELDDATLRNAYVVTRTVLLTHILMKSACTYVVIEKELI